jgi:hypothetical protein
MTLKRYVLLFLVLTLPFAITLLNGKSQVVHAQTSVVSRVSGQVLDVGTDRPTQCPTSGYPGLNGVVVSLSGIGGTFTATTQVGGSGQSGAFYIENVPDGLYNLCISTLPDTLHSYYCSVQSWQPPQPTPTRDPFQVQCIKVEVKGADVAGLRMAVKTDVAVSPTAPISPQLTTQVSLAPSPTGVISCGRFQDTQGTTFEPYIQCLACNGSISGYSCGAAPAGACVPPDNLEYFLPGNDITRAQMMKIVTMTAKYADQIPATQQTFADVPTSHPFWQYIERAALHQIISGYTCGGVGEPCDSQNRPYFRPSNAITRAQTAKVTTLAVGYNESIPTTQQTFADVAPSHPFWVFVERAAMHNLISGYTCGGTGEPCDAQSRPYYRPDVNITRGQASKVTAVGFGCQLPSVSITPGTCSLRGKGDTDCDGVVDLKDYFYYVKKINNGAMPAGVNADVNNDGFVNSLDRQIIISNISGAPSPTAGVSPTP